MPEVCHHCGYELTGLSLQGTCPECGKFYDTHSAYRTRDRPDNPIARHAKPITLGVVALTILSCGGLISIGATKPWSIVIGALIVAALPAFGAFVYWWSDRQERRESD